MNKKPATPRDASAIILISQDQKKVLWARRNPKLKFLGGFQGFIGGKVDKNDAEVEVRNCQDKTKAELIACAARETFEEVGVLLVRNGDKLTKGQRSSLHDDLISGRNTFAEILELWGLWLDAEDFTYTGFWTTPEFSQIRFKTRFFMALCPPKQEPYQAIDELEKIEFIKPKKAVKKWSESKALVVPPVLMPLKTLAENNSEGLLKISKKLLKQSQEADGKINYIELNSRTVCLPLKTETLPPATHTNCFIVGKKEFIVIDAATPYEDERQKLFELVDKMIETGSICKEIIVSHLHPDHFGAETALKEHLMDKFDLDVPISAHILTAKSLAGQIKIDKYIEDKHSYNLKDVSGNIFKIEVLHTPGHARGHLCFYDKEYGFLLSLDNVVGQGTVVIAPPEGNMSDYLNSLARMKNLPHLHFLCGSHGSAVYDAKGRIESYIQHRLDREEQVLQLVRQGITELDEFVSRIYENLDSRLIPLAKKSIEAHLEKLKFENRISFTG